MLRLVEIFQVILKEKILKFQRIFPILFLSHLEKGVALYLNKLVSPSHKDALCMLSVVEISTWFCRKRRKCKKLTDGQKDKGQIIGDRESFQLR